MKIKNIPLLLFINLILLVIIGSVDLKYCPEHLKLDSCHLAEDINFGPDHTED